MSRLKEASEIIKLMEPVEGEIRRVYECCDCQKLFGRRFIPFS